MAEERVVGIDLGTTNSLVAFMQGDQPVVIPGEDGDRLVPSVVAWTDDGIAVGHAARTTLLTDSANAVYSAKRLMGRDLNDVQAGAINACLIVRQLQNNFSICQVALLEQ